MASDEDPVIISFKEAALRQTDLATLQPREWLGDAVISLMSELLQDRENTVLIWQPPIVELMCSLDGSSAKELLPPTADLMLLPVSDHYESGGSASHWSCLLVQRNVKDAKQPWSALHFDSLSPANQPAAEVVWKAFLQAQGESTKASKDSLRQIEVVRQENAHDCGLYMLRLADDLSRRSNEEDLQDVDLSSHAESLTSERVGALRAGLLEWLETWDETHWETWEDVKKRFGDYRDFIGE